METDLERFTQFLFGDLQGIVYSPAAGRDVWSQKFFDWPNERVELHDWIVTASSNSDVYLSPVLYKDRQATKSAIKCGQVTWVEFDGDTQIDFRDIPHPGAIVQTSSNTHLHAYWGIEVADSQTLEELNKRLTLYLKADSSGWDSTQLLRPPGTQNFKYERPLPVSLTHFGAYLYSRESFNAAPPIETPKSIIKQEQLPNAKKLLLSTALPVSLRKKLKEETAPVGSRSSFLAKIAMELAEEGLGHSEIVSLLALADDRIGKFNGRTDAFERLSSLAEFAILKVDQIDRPVVLTIKQVLDYSESLDWIIPGWIHTNGFLILTSAPGVGKTQLALQLAVALSARSPFLGKSIQKKDLSILFLSLEMEFKAIKSFLDFQSTCWPKDLDYSKVRIMDEYVSLTNLENMIDEFRPNVVILDSLSELLEEGENPNEQSKSVMRWIRKVRRRYNCAIIAIHHNRKASEGNKKPNKLSDLYGSFHFARVVETVLCLWEDTRGTLELSAIKTRFGPRDKFFIKRNESLIFEKVENASRESGSDQQVKGGAKSVPGFGSRH